MRTTAVSVIRSTAILLPDQAHQDVDLFQRLQADPAAERRALVARLRSHPASIAPRYFYDALGCALFGAICELPEYYPTRVERSIFARHRADIAAAIGTATQLVDLGAGDCGKAREWLPVLAPSRYVGVDIAADALRAGLHRIALEFADLEVSGVVTDFSRGLDLGAALERGRVTFFYPGSSIGNFTPEEASGFLRDIRAHCAAPGSGLLIGVDTRKDPARLEAAYADRLGVTAAFNRNVLVHVNRVLGCDFDPQAFAHVARYDAGLGRIEMHLQSTRDQVVHIDGVPRPFGAGERIHTESSYKYAPAQFVAMLEAAGFASVRTWQDDDGDFAVYYAAA
ncbi:MAG TPA: L-histidine N(alpha)-methyltransferase [Casimicrobiaceae bacterium]|nr:L-histidine N(alpha)-methyltransferase [Casimicrobiaceae bacterium]